MSPARKNLSTGGAVSRQNVKYVLPALFLLSINRGNIEVAEVKRWVLAQRRNLVHRGVRAWTQSRKPRRRLHLATVTNPVSHQQSVSHAPYRHLACSPALVIKPAVFLCLRNFGLSVAMENGCYEHRRSRFSDGELTGTKSLRSLTCRQ